jgi:protease I
MRVLLIIAEKYFQDIELSHTKEELEKRGFIVDVASKTRGIKKGALGGTAEAKLSLKEVNVDDYDAVAFIGGGGAQQYFQDKEALKIIQESFRKGKLTAGICMGPLILANAGILKGKKATVWDAGDGEMIAELESKGAKFINQDVVRDGRIITACGPHAARDFGKTIADNLKKQRNN